MLNLKTITPQTPEEFERYRDDFKFLANFFPFKLSEPELREFLDTRIGWVTLVYVNELLIGSFVMDVSPKSVELHGICRPDIDQLIPDSQRVKTYVTRLIFNDIFIYMNRSKCVIKAFPGNKGVRGFALMNGFQRLPNTDKRRNVWVLSRQRYYERLKQRASNVQRPQEHPAVNRQVPV